MPLMGSLDPSGKSQKKKNWKPWLLTASPRSRQRSPTPPSPALKAREDPDRRSTSHNSRAYIGPASSTPGPTPHDHFLSPTSAPPKQILRQSLEVKEDETHKSLVFQLDGGAKMTQSHSSLIDGTASSVPLSLSDKDCHLVDISDEVPAVISGFCEVYVAFHRPTKLKLAMKRPKFFFDSESQRRFRREAEIWTKFEHRNILPFFGIMEINKHLHLVSPWLELGDLFKFVQSRLACVTEEPFSKCGSDDRLRSHYLDFNETRTIQEIAAGIEYLHSHGVIHGDIKARNVLLSDDGCAKICDFGLSKTIDHAATSTAVKGTGTLRWQAPELLGGESKTFSSDIYAFAMTISEIRAANYPFPHHNNQGAIITAVFVNNERPPFQPLSRLGVDFQPLWELAARCWEKEPGNRPTIKEILQQIGAL